MPPITLILAMDDRICREILHEKLTGLDNIHVVAEADDGLTAIHLAHKLRPDIALIDTMLPGLDGIKAIRRILAQVPSCKIIALSAYTGQNYIDRMRQAGAMGYITNIEAMHDVSTMIKTVMAGQFYFNPRFAAFSPVESPPPTLLSAREHKVLTCLRKDTIHPRLPRY